MATQSMNIQLWCVEVGKELHHLGFSKKVDPAKLEDILQSAYRNGADPATTANIIVESTTA